MSFEGNISAALVKACEQDNDEDALQIFFFIALPLLLCSWERLSWVPLPKETVDAWTGSQKFNSFSRSLP